MVNTVPRYNRQRAAQRIRAENVQPLFVLCLVAALLGTSVYTQPTAIPSPSDTPGLIRVTDDCPTKVRGPLTDASATITAQGRLATSVLRAQAYVATQEETFGELGFAGENSATLMVSFTSDLQLHADALSLIVDMPDSVVVCRARRTAMALTTQVTEISRTYPGLRGVTGDGQIAEVYVNADRQDVADAIVTRYGSDVRVWLGMFRYPDASVPDSPGIDRTCGELPTAATTDKRLRWTTSKRLHVRSGGSITVPVRLTNVGRVTIPDLTVSAVIGLITRKGERQVLGVSLQEVSLLLQLKTLKPGASTRRDSLIGAASCNASLGWALPPGTGYEVHFVTTSLEPLSDGGNLPRPYQSPPFPITITR